MNAFQNLTILSLLTPLLGFLITSAVKSSYRSHIVSIGITGISLFSTILLSTKFFIDLPVTGALTYSYGIFSTFTLQLSLDRLNATLLPIISLVYFLILYSSSNVHHKRIYPQNILISQFLTYVIILSPASPQLLFFLLLQPVQPFLEIKKRKTGSRVFGLYMAVSTVFILLACLSMYFLAGHRGQTYFVATFLSIGLLIRSGIFPLHSWLHDMIGKSSFSTAILFLLPLCPVYAFIKMVLPITPLWLMQSIAILSLLTSLYAAGVNFVQKDLRHFFGNLFLSNSSLLLAGIELGTEISITGSLCIWISMLLSLTGFAIALQAVESRVGRLNLGFYHGLYEQMPQIAGFFIITGLASIGFPLTVGFIAIELLIEGAVEIYPFIGITIILTSALNGIAILYSYFQIFTGKQVESAVVLLVKPKERIAIVLLTILIIAGGLYPQPGVASQYFTSKQIIDTRK